MPTPTGVRSAARRGGTTGRSSHRACADKNRAPYRPGNLASGVTAPTSPPGSDKRISCG